MELDFDKEIDTLLRKARPDNGVPSGDIASPHLDADGIAAYAENALPGTLRLAYTSHFADCNRCRGILSDTILLNSEAAPEAAFAGAPLVISAAEPWYRKLFLFPNLAYVMGSLVLVFSGFIGYSLFQNADGNSSFEVSQIEDAPSIASGPNAEEEPSYPANANSSIMTNAANSMSAAANTMANAAAVNKVTATSNSNAMQVAPIRSLDAPSEQTLPQPTSGVTLDGASAAESRPAPPPAPILKELDRTEDKAALSAKDAKSKSAVAETRELTEQSVMRKQMPRTDRGPAKSAGPQRNQQNQFPNQVQNNEYEVAVTRAVGGKKFQRKDGVWLDTSYRGQGTINIRRGTEQYRKLDSGLRSIAESLDGAVVTVWKGKAFRIQ